MALVNKSELQKMDYLFQGEPFVNVPAKTGIDTFTMDYLFNGEPFVTNPSSTGNSNFFIFL